MKTNVFKIGLAAILACFISISTASAAVPDLSENMTQGQFALWLVAAVGASDKLPASATEQDAIDFLTKLNIQPAEGWKKTEVITKAFLASLLGDDSAASLDFSELIERVKNMVDGIFNDVHSGLFRAFSSSGSGSVTI